jgi:RNA recognition motif-containing protein
MGRKLYVGNLPYSATEETLTEKFAEFGSVESAKLITDRDTGRSKGFGFVEMGNAAEAQAAIKGLNGVDYGGRPMKVNEAKPQEKRSGGGGGRGGYGGGGGGGGGNRW